MKVDVLEDWGDVIAVNKPAGWLTIPGRGAKSSPILSEILGNQLRGSQVRPKENDLWIVHRLDEGTSGIVLFARTKEAHKTLSQQFENHSVKKSYLTIVTGELNDNRVDAPIFKIPSKKIRYVIDPKGKPSQTLFKVLSTNTTYSLVLATPLTGRPHQIRVHLAHLGHPIVGDRLYGGEPTPDSQFYLHAHQIEFQYPMGEVRKALAPLPDPFQSFLSRSSLSLNT